MRLFMIVGLVLFSREIHQPKPVTQLEFLFCIPASHGTEKFLVIENIIWITLRR